MTRKTLRRGYPFTPDDMNEIPFNTKNITGGFKESRKKGVRSTH